MDLISCWEVLVDCMAGCRIKKRCVIYLIIFCSFVLYVCFYLFSINNSSAIPFISKEEGFKKQALENSLKFFNSDTLSK
jgi:hypothetical protein